MRKWNQIFNIFTALMKTRNCGYFKEILNGTVGLVHGIGLISIRLSWDLMAAWNGD
jgi:hypothetical protein